MIIFWIIWIRLYWPNVGKDVKEFVKLCDYISVKGAREDADGRACCAYSLFQCQVILGKISAWTWLYMLVYHERKVVRTQFLRLWIISPKWLILYLQLPLWMPEEQHSFMWTMFLWSMGLANPLCQIVIPDSLLPSGRSCLPCLERN